MGERQVARLCKLSGDLPPSGSLLSLAMTSKLGKFGDFCGAVLALGGVYEALNNDTRVGTL